MRHLLAWALVLIPFSALAQEDEDEDVQVVAPGPTDHRPGPAEAPAPPPPRGNADERRAVRGAAVEIDPPAEDPLQKQMRDFEDEAFGGDAARADRDADETRPLGKERLPPDLMSPHRTVRPVAAKRPEDVRPDLPWLKGLKTGDIPVRWDPRVIRYLEFYRNDPKGRSIMGGWLKAKGRFDRLIGESLRRHGLPQDLVYLCMIESSFDTREYSRAGASGLWQFMPSGTIVYGLRMDYWVDERNDPVRSTEAVMDYWQDLKERFGNWHLAMAAYNAGFGAVLKSIAKYNTNDFWYLLDLEGGLPWESSIYVPKALAAMVVGHNLEAFGYADVATDPVFEYDRVTVDKSVPLAIIARAAGTDLRTITDLNPQLIRGRTPPASTGFEVRIPRGSKAKFTASFPGLRGDWDGYDAYVVRYGERFEDIAKTYGISVKQLRDLNGVTDQLEVRGGTIIVVPRIDADVRKKNRAAADIDLYRSEVAPGGPGDPMIVALPHKDLVVPGKKRVFYRVVGGDTLASVAKVFALDPGDLAGWNDLDLDANIQPRMVLVAYVPEKFDAEKANVALLDESRLMLVQAGSPEHLDIYEGRKGRVRKTVIVKRGETLESIGKPHHLSKYDMARINRRSYYTPLVPGEQLVVYVVIDKAKARKSGVYDVKKRPAGKHTPPRKAKKKK